MARPLDTIDNVVQIEMYCLLLFFVHFLVLNGKFKFHSHYFCSEKKLWAM